jgi:hypothetical protein
VPARRRWMAGPSAMNHALADLVADLNTRLLSEAAVLIGLVIFLQLVKTHAACLGIEVAFIRDDDPVRIDVHDLSGALGQKAAARILGHLALDAGADQRLLGHEQRHRLTLHVRTHEGAVGVIVLQERDERR